jgi:hypothetical protein
MTVAPRRNRRLLVANRSEIAIRVFRAATELGIQTVAIYAEEDKLSLHRSKSDEAYRVGRGKGPLEAYLDIEEVIRVAKDHDVDAIHPGYGFLSASPEFAEACAEAEIIFIGPMPETMRTLGNKVAARNLAVAVGAPVMPATDPLTDDTVTIRRLGGRRSATPSCSRRPGVAVGAACGPSSARSNCSMPSTRPGARPRRRSAKTRFTSRSWCAARGTSRLSSWATTMATLFTCSNATARSNAGTRR